MPRTRSSCEPRGGKCVSREIWPRWSVMKPLLKMTASVCGAPSRASASAPASSRENPHQPMRRSPAGSCDAPDTGLRHSRESHNNTTAGALAYFCLLPHIYFTQTSGSSYFSYIFYFICIFSMYFIWFCGLMHDCCK